jgi:hypothetical protein
MMVIIMVLRVWTNEFQGASQSLVSVLTYKDSAFHPTGSSTVRYMSKYANYTYH